MGSTLTLVPSANQRPQLPCFFRGTPLEYWSCFAHKHWDECWATFRQWLTSAKVRKPRSLPLDWDNLKVKSTLQNVLVASDETYPPLDFARSHTLTWLCPFPDLLPPLACQFSQGDVPNQSLIHQSSSHSLLLENQTKDSNLAQVYENKWALIPSCRITARL